MSSDLFGKKNTGDGMNKYGKVQECWGENISLGLDDAMKVMLALIIDDGVPDRTHRTNVFSTNFHVVGIACGAHKEY